MRSLPLIAAVVALAGAAAAEAPSSDTPAEVIASAPPAARQAAFAAHPQARGVEGRTVARCKVSAAGAISECRTVVDTPANSGLAPVLLDLAPQYRAKPAIHAGQPVDGEILIEIQTYRYDKPADWLHKPTANDLLRVYPTEALRRGIAGQAVISCLASAQGVLFDCYVQRESPPGVGSARRGSRSRRSS
jgi:hypothetical protein